VTIEYSDNEDRQVAFKMDVIEEGANQMEMNLREHVMSACIESLNVLKETGESDQ
jgi:hypothetical protein